MKSMYTSVVGHNLAIIDVMPVADRKATITRVNTPAPLRGSGIAGRLLREVCREADEEGVSLELVIVASGDMTAEQLFNWYKRHGFVSMPAASHPYIMHRLPN